MGSIIRAVAAENNIKIAVISAPDIVERARVIHSLSPTASAALGRTLLGASLLELGHSNYSYRNSWRPVTCFFRF